MSNSHFCRYEVQSSPIYGVTAAVETIIIYTRPTSLQMDSGERLCLGEGRGELFYPQMTLMTQIFRGEAISTSPKVH